MFGLTGPEYPTVWLQTDQEREELAYSLLASLPRSRLACIQRRIAPLLQFDLVASLPTEISLQIFSNFSYDTLLLCAQVCCRWRVLADDQTLWKRLCDDRGWQWKQPPGVQESSLSDTMDGEVDEGMGDEEDAWPVGAINDSGSASSSADLDDLIESIIPQESTRLPEDRFLLPTAPPPLKPNYKLLYLTHTRLRARVRTGQYVYSTLQTRIIPREVPDGHTNTIYCLQLYTHPQTGVQSLFTGSKDRTIRQWSLATRKVGKIISGVHLGSVLSISVVNGFCASGSSDRRVVVWDLDGEVAGKLVGVIADHTDSVLCVRIDENILVSCSKDRTVRTYSFPGLQPRFVLEGHRAAVNAIAISQGLIVSGSGDRSIRLWDATTGSLLRTFENHHTRGIASIDFSPPHVLSGSSDMHIRLFDVHAYTSWSTSADTLVPSHLGQLGHCQACSVGTAHTHMTTIVLPPDTVRPRGAFMHRDLVRSVALGEEFVVSGSYDLTIKVWERATGAVVADLVGGHTGRIFCIAADCTKIVSCGEDQRICIWDFSHGIDTSFIKF